MKPKIPTLQSKMALAGLVALVAVLAAPAATLACGGFFCTTSPINQQVERIIFTQRGSEIAAYVQINYTGDDADFAWVVPVPSVPEVDVAEMDMFLELDTMTAPIYIGPPIPECALQDLALPALSVAEGAGGGVTVFSSGEVGPFGFDVIGSEDSEALINWLKDNGYRITPEMEPLVHVYVEEQMLFLAMKLRPGAGVQDIQPVVMKYKSDRPMIPLRLTAVAANPNMGVLVWLLGNTQYESDNYRKLDIPDSDIQFFPFGGSNYFGLRTQAIDNVSGQGFVTEFAGPTTGLTAVDEDLRALLSEYPYLTRVYTEISPEEMTVDPTFQYNESLPPLSNVHDLSNSPSPYECAQNTVEIAVPTAVQQAAPGVVSEVAPRGVIVVPKTLIYFGAAALVGGALLLAGLFIGRRAGKR
ncbi:MAG: DUF2330 domain-containing protein [Chloroflexi bacterium]|nr:DUF2330 domain-containing protein [Chloroflexota bacterium]